jgi:aryl-alcohol dehydrogenase-like predicted oxidoreductase
MEYVTLGKTGERVSKIAFGGATAGIPNYIKKFDAEKKEDREPVIEAIRYAYEQGINYFDTAYSYGDGAAERIFGEALHYRKV